MKYALHKYWMKEFFKFFFIIQLLILVLFVFIDYLSRLERFLNSEISLVGAAVYILLKVPYMFMQLTPASILLSVITVFGLMNKNNELLAIRSSGISIYFLIRPALVAGFCLAGLMFFLGETIIPVTMTKMYNIKHNIILKRHDLSAAREDVWIKSGSRLVHINYFNPAQLTVGGVTITVLDDAFNLDQRIDAGKGRYVDGAWVFEDVIEQIHETDDFNYDVKMYDRKVVDLDIQPEDLEAIAKKSEEMSFTELSRYISKIESEGYDATTYRVDLYGKIAFPFICVIMILAGATTGMKSFVKENLPAGIAVGIVFAFLYWVMYGFCLSLGYGQILPPLVSSWVTNLFFLAFGTLYLLNTE